MTKISFIPNKNFFLPKTKRKINGFGKVSKFFKNPQIKLTGWTIAGAGSVATSFALGMPQPTLAETIGTAWAGGIFGGMAGLGTGMASSLYSTLKKKKRR
jgi:hypothetical protein